MQTDNKDIQGMEKFIGEKEKVNEALSMIRIEIIADEKNNQIVAKDFSVSKSGNVIADSKPDNFHKTYTKLYNSIMSIIKKG